MNRLLFVFRNARAKRVDTQCCGRSNSNGVLRWEVKTLAQRRHRRRGDLLREALVIDIRDVVNAQAALPCCGIGIFAARLNIEDCSFVAGDGVEQDDYVTNAGAANFQAPTQMRADQLLINGVRLPYSRFRAIPRTSWSRTILNFRFSSFFCA